MIILGAIIIILFVLIVNIILFLTIIIKVDWKYEGITLIQLDEIICSIGIITITLALLYGYFIHIYYGENGVKEESKRLDAYIKRHTNYDLKEVKIKIEYI